VRLKSAGFAQGTAARAMSWKLLIRETINISGDTWDERIKKSGPPVVSHTGEDEGRPAY
jgi:hypothetical protein